MEEEKSDKVELAGIELFSSNRKFYHDRCVLCQRSDKSGCKKAGQGTADAIACLKRAADVKDDFVVKKRIVALEEEKKPLLYHNTYDCFKKYTKFAAEKDDPNQKSEYDNAQTENISQASNDNSTTLTPMVRRSSVVPREKPVGQEKKKVNPKERNCTVCGSDRVWEKKSKKQIREKFRISEEAVAQSFLDATRFFKDAVFSRTADITSPKRLTAADLYCHRKCLREYFKKNKEESTSKTEDTPEPPNRKKELFHLALKELDKQIND